MSGNTGLNKAKDAKQDEFYTQLSDIEKELRYYKKYFHGKTVFCNCDDPYESNFFKYFVLNFNRLGLEKLIATCYAGSPIANTQLSLFDVPGCKGSGIAYKAVVTTVYDKTGDGSVDMVDIAELFKSGENEITELKGDGDFRSEESIELLKEADIVVTNPPFSLFREYVAQLIEYDKKFVILGNINALKYKEIFPLIQQGMLWSGMGFNMSLVYKTPYENKLEANRKFVVAKGYRPEEGFIKVPAACWYTNLDLKKRHEDLILVKKYSPDLYPNYDNYDGIDVSSISEIPRDYAGNMGVPITIMEHFNPDQFELIGTSTGALGRSIGVTPNYRGRTDVSFTDQNGVHHCPYQRFIIRNKKPER